MRTQLARSFAVLAVAGGIALVPGGTASAAHCTDAGGPGNSDFADHVRASNGPGGHDEGDHRGWSSCQETSANFPG